MRLAAPIAIGAIVDFLRRSSCLALVRVVLYPRESRAAYRIHADALQAIR
jgi:hypothetical protein